jgi:hypothetical protein
VPTEALRIGQFVRFRTWQHPAHGRSPDYVRLYALFTLVGIADEDDIDAPNRGRSAAKSATKFALPLCRSHHGAVPRAGDEQAWWKVAGIDPVKVSGRRPTDDCYPEWPIELIASSTYVRFSGRRGCLPNLEFGQEHRCLIETRLEAYRFVQAASTGQGKQADARKAFEESNAISSDYLPAVERLVDLDLADKYK